MTAEFLQGAYDYTLNFLGYGVATSLKTKNSPGFSKRNRPNLSEPLELKDARLDFENWPDAKTTMEQFITKAETRATFKAQQLKITELDAYTALQECIGFSNKAESNLCVYIKKELNNFATANGRIAYQFPNTLITFTLTSTSDYIKQALTNIANASPNDFMATVKHLGTEIGKLSEKDCMANGIPVRIADELQAKLVNSALLMGTVTSALMLYGAYRASKRRSAGGKFTLLAALAIGTVSAIPSLGGLPLPVAGIVAMGGTAVATHLITSTMNYFRSRSAEKGPEIPEDDKGKIQYMHDALQYLLNVPGVWGPSRLLGLNEDSDTISSKYKYYASLVAGLSSVGVLSFQALIESRYYGVGLAFTVANGLAVGLSELATPKMQTFIDAVSILKPTVTALEESTVYEVASKLMQALKEGSKYKVIDESPERRAFVFRLAMYVHEHDRLGGRKEDIVLANFTDVINAAERKITN
jgi:hypothetical protein